MYPTDPTVTNNRTIEITGDFDSGNPKDPRSIIRTGDNSFTIVPFSEDGDPNYKFKLDIKALNGTPRNQKVLLKIEWQDGEYKSLRDYLFARNEEENDWRYLPATVNGTGAMCKIDLAPGETYLCMHPKYSYQDYIGSLNNLDESEEIQKELIGCTTGARELWMIRITPKNLMPKKKMLLVARIHPYETAGSFCMEGIISHLQHNLSSFSADNLPIEVFLIPMANPDGVFYGFCKKTADHGIDLSKEVNPADSTSALLKTAIDFVQPHIYCEFHNWMFKNADGLYFLNWLQAHRFTGNMPSQSYCRKTWRLALRKKIFSIRHLGFKKYCKEKFGSTCLSVEYPWFGRTVADMKKLGIDTLNALTKI